MEENITRRDAIKKMGVSAATIAMSVSGASAIASCANAVVGEGGRPLNVLLINGSARRNGNTYTLLSEIASQLKKMELKAKL